jgi:hypothetical protein
MGKLDGAREQLDLCITSNPECKRAYLLRGKLIADAYFKNYSQARFRGGVAVLVVLAVVVLVSMLVLVLVLVGLGRWCW